MNKTTFVEVEFGDQPPLRLKGPDSFAIAAGIRSVFEAQEWTPEKSYLYSSFKNGEVMEILCVPKPDFSVFEQASAAFGIKYAKLLEKSDIVYIMTSSRMAARIELLNRNKRTKAVTSPTSLSYTSQNVIDALQGNREPTLFTEDIVKALENPDLMAAWTDEQYREFIFLLASMPKYSHRNTQLIEKQRPGAELVASKSYWRSMGRELVQTPSAISIWMPVEGAYTQFKNTDVYDVRDTHTVEAPVQEDVLVDKSEEVEEVFRKISTLTSVPIQQSQNAKEACYLPDKVIIQIPEWKGDAEQLSEMLREIAHGQLHKEHGNAYSREKYAFAAESIACALATRLRAPNYIYNFDMKDKFAEPSRIKEYVQAAKVMTEDLTKRNKVKQQKSPEIELI